MNRLLAMTVLILLTTACDDGPAVVVQATLGEQNASTPVQGLPVRLLPYDRDAVFDSLTGAADAPEPTLSPELLQQLSRLDSLPSGSAPGPDSGGASPEVLRRVILARVDSVRAARRAWAEEAYRGFNEAVAARVEAAGRQEVVDTTDAAGVARLPAEAGEWWLYASYTLPEQELYWNIPVTVTADSLRVPLTRKNAKERPLF